MGVPLEIRPGNILQSKPSQLLNIIILVIIGYCLYSFDYREQFFILVITGYGDRLKVIRSFYLVSNRLMRHLCIFCEILYLLSYCYTPTSRNTILFINYFN